MIRIANTGLTKDAKVGVWSVTNEEKSDQFAQTVSGDAKSSTNRKYLSLLKNDRTNKSDTSDEPLEGMPAPSGQGIVWGDPICKVTEQPNASKDPNVIPFNTIQEAADYLYKVGSTSTLKSGDYEGMFPLEMLIDTYELPSTVTFKYGAKKVVFTTASKDVPEYDVYPFKGEATTTTITQKEDAQTRMFSLNPANLTIKNLTIDAKNVEVGNVNGVMFSLSSSAALTLGDKATLQNAKTEGNGAGVYIVGSSASFTMDAGSKLTKCEAVDGAGVYSEGGAITLNAGEITECKASGSGGALYVKGSKNTHAITGEIKITSNEAAKGGAIHSAGSAVVNINGTASITGNKTTTEGQAAVSAEGTAKYRVSGNLTIHDNWDSNGEEGKNQRNLFDSTAKDVASIIQVGADGLGSSAKVGVYSTNNYKEGRVFARTVDASGKKTTSQTSTNVDNLGKFENDRNGELFGSYGEEDAVIWPAEQWLDITMVLPDTGSSYDNTRYVVEIKNKKTGATYRQAVTVTSNEEGATGTAAVMLRPNVDYQITVKSNNGTWRYVYASAALDGTEKENDKWTEATEEGATYNGTLNLKATFEDEVKSGQHELKITTKEKTSKYIDAQAGVVNEFKKEEA